MTDQLKVLKCVNWMSDQGEESEIQQWVLMLGGIPAKWVEDDKFCTFSQVDDFVRAVYREVAVSYRCQDEDLLAGGSKNIYEAMLPFDKKSQMEGADHGFEQIAHYGAMIKAAVRELMTNGPAPDEETAMVTLLRSWDLFCKARAAHVAGQPLGFG